jgi:isopenicillin-N epimerase
MTQLMDRAVPMPNVEPGGNPAASPWASHWLLRHDVAYLNHGSFGACPAAILEYQRQLVHELERQPMDFLVRERSVGSSARVRMTWPSW